MNKLLNWTIVLLFATGASISSAAEGRNYREGRGGNSRGGNGNVGANRPNRPQGPGNVGGSNRPNRPQPGPGNVGPGNGGGRGPGRDGNVGGNRPNRPQPGPGNVGPGNGGGRGPGRDGNVGGNRPNRPQPGPGNVGPGNGGGRGPGRDGNIGGNRPNRPQPGPGNGGGRGPGRDGNGPGYGGGRGPGGPGPGNGGGRGPGRDGNGPGYGGGRGPGGPGHVGGYRPRPDNNRWTTNFNRYGSREGWNFGRNYRYSRYNHSPYRNIPRGHYTFHSPRDFFRTIPYRHIYFNNWLRLRVNYANGYYWNNNYPWFVYNGFQHRYSDQDVCNYELVDGRLNQTLDTFYGQYCNVGYDRCSDARDAANYQAGEYRYFCSERVEDGEDYGWDYNDDFYSDISNGDGYYNDTY